MNSSIVFRLATLAGVAAGVGLAACSGNQPPGQTLDSGVCGGAIPDPGSLTRVFGLGGSYVLVLRARSGERSSETTQGELRLVPQDSVGVPFYGWTDVSLDDIGAHRLGDPSSTDRSAPGVLVLLSPDTASPGRPGSVTLRIGSQANRSDIVRFDGAYTALYVRWIEKDAFGGDWTSGVTGPEAEGEFCAVQSDSS